MQAAGFRELPLTRELIKHSPGSRERAMLDQMTAAAAPLSSRPRSGRRRNRPRGHLWSRSPDPHPALPLFPHSEAASASNVSGRGEIDLMSRAAVATAAATAAEGPLASLGDRVQQAGVAVGVAAAAAVIVFVHGQRREVGVRAGVGEGEGGALRCEIPHGVAAANCRNSKLNRQQKSRINMHFPPDDTELMGAVAGTGRPLPREPGRLAAAGMGMPLLFRPSRRLEGRELKRKSESRRE